MCVNCVSNTEFVLASGSLGAYALAQPARNALVALGVLPEPDPLARDVRTVAFLRRLELDPNEVLGEAVVAAVDAWEPSAPVYREPALRRLYRAAGSLGAIRSQSTLPVTQ
jgi:hypothetical protein